MAYWQADIAGAERAYAEAVEIERGLDDPAGLAGALYNAGFVAALTGDGPRARAEYDEAIRIYETIGDRKGLLTVREALVFIHLHAGDSRPREPSDGRSWRTSGSPANRCGSRAP